MAAPTPPDGLDYGALIAGLGGGLALFLYGMRKMTESLKVAAGGSMKRLLSKVTTNRFTGALGGAGVTAVVQSSSVTTVMVVGFVTAGLMTFSQSIGVIIGANIGTTITAQIIAFKVTDYALVMIAFGFLAELLGRTTRQRHVGIMVMGLGLLFFGMGLMSDAAMPLRTYQPFIAMMQELRNPLLGILVGMVFTTLVQSSSATTGIVIVLSTQGLITLEAGIALVLGANVGTCVTAMLVAIGKPREAVKAATVHVIFNLGGVLLFVFFIPQFADLVRAISPQMHDLSGKDRLAAEVPRQIANAHTISKLVSALIFLTITDSLARLVERIVPKPKPKPAGPGTPEFLQPMFLDQPALALDRVKHELERLGELATDMADRSVPVMLTGTEAALNDLQAQDEHVDQLHGEIVAYLGDLSMRELLDSQPEQVHRCVAASNYLENLADVVETGLVVSGRRRREHEIVLSPEIADPILELHAKTINIIRDSIKAFLAGDVKTARAVQASRKEFNRDADRIRLLLGRVLAGSGRSGLRVYRIGMDTVENLKRLHTLSRRIAKLTREDATDDETEETGATDALPPASESEMDAVAGGGSVEVKADAERRPKQRR